MAIYRYSHDCGMEQTLYLANENASTKVVPCLRCGRTVTAHQVRDKSVKIGHADGTTGVLRRNDAATKAKGGRVNERGIL